MNTTIEKQDETTKTKTWSSGGETARETARGAAVKGGEAAAGEGETAAGKRRRGERPGVERPLRERRALNQIRTFRVGQREAETGGGTWR